MHAPNDDHEAGMEDNQDCEDEVPRATPPSRAHAAGEEQGGEGSRRERAEETRVGPDGSGGKADEEPGIPGPTNIRGGGGRGESGKRALQGGPPPDVDHWTFVKQLREERRSVRAGQIMPPDTPTL